jgi:peptidyl-prolyl cis-trans isomerase A (cyclophilin A)
MKKNITLLMLFVMGLTASAQSSKKPTATTKKTTTATQTQSKDEGMFAEIETSRGKIVLALEYQKTPITVANFVSLAEGTNTEVKEEKLKGKRFYDGLKFHRVIADFMIQGGDPNGNGSGGPGYAFKDEIVPELKHSKPGILSMANSGPKTNGSQFFITHKDTPWLDGKHTVFGHVITGQDVVNAIKQDDVITKVTIVRKGANAKAFDAAKVFSTYMTNKAEEDKKEQEIVAENKRKAEEAEALKKAEYEAKFGKVISDKKAYFLNLQKSATTTETGLQYAIISKGNGVKPEEGKNILVNYSGYLENGTLFDSSIEQVNKDYGMFDENRAKANGYAPFPFKYGNKGGLIPGFLEALNFMNYGDKLVAFIPANLGYGSRGAGNVIPPNSNIIFEIEISEDIKK